jgi:hypothetical protein
MTKNSVLMAAFFLGLVSGWLSGWKYKKPGEKMLAAKT